VSRDGTLVLSGPPNTAFRVAIYLGKKQLISQNHVLYDDGVLDPPEIDATAGAPAKRPPRARPVAKTPDPTKPQMDTKAE
jgi:hypothetical protein